jgi:hypothetical protein
MSIELLEVLNGEARGLFRERIERFRAEGPPRLAWYPSAGDDLRDVLYLSERFSARNRGTLPDPPPPDLFIHTDARLPWRFDQWSERGAHRDRKTHIRVLARERLADLHLPVDERLVMPPDGPTGHVEFFELEVESRRQGLFRACLLFVQAENAAFCARRLLPCRARVTHLVQVRYGHGEGGARTNGEWLQYLTEALGTEVLISDPHLRPGLGSGYPVSRRYRELERAFAETRLTRPIRTLRGRRWSEHGNVTWWLRGAEPPERWYGERIDLPRDDSARVRRLCRDLELEERDLLAHLVRRALDAGLVPDARELEAMRGVLI